MAHTTMSRVNRNQAERLAKTTNIEERLTINAEIARDEYKKTKGVHIDIIPNVNEDHRYLKILKILEQIAIFSGITNINKLAKKYSAVPTNPKEYLGYEITTNNFFFDENRDLHLYNGKGWISDFSKTNNRRTFGKGVFRKFGMKPDLRFFNMANGRGFIFEHKEQQDKGNADERNSRWHVPTIIALLRSILNLPKDMYPVGGIFTGGQVKVPGCRRAIESQFGNNRDNCLIVDMDKRSSNKEIREYFLNIVFPMMH